MEIGLYQAKYPFRKLLAFLLQRFKHIHPNYISSLLFPIGLITAWVYYEASTFPAYYWAGIGLIFIRMVVGTLDGMVAETFHKQSANGAIINRLAPEAADMCLMVALILGQPHHPLLGMCALVACWGISYTGLVGLVGGKSIQSLGPAGQTDRIVVLMLLSFLQICSTYYHWQWNMIVLFFWWTLVGGALTILLRCYKIIREKSHGRQK